MTSLLEMIDTRIAELHRLSDSWFNDYDYPTKAKWCLERKVELEHFRQKVIEITKELDMYTIQAPTPVGYVLKRDIDRIIGKSG